MIHFALLAFIAAATPLPQVGVDQKLNQEIPLSLVFHDEAGRAVRLGDYFGKRPVILTPAYFQCPMLCTLVLNDVTRAMRSMPLTLGADYEVVTVSFNPRETPELAASKKRSYIESLGAKKGSPAGWHFLTGGPAEIKQLMNAIGYRYAYDAKTDQYAHASAIMVLTPEGRLAKYFYGLDYAPRDLRLALVEASHEQIGSPADQILLFCFHYNPITGKYTVAVENALRVGGVAIVLAMAALFMVLRRRGAPALSR
jgi:protein SCO1